MNSNFPFFSALLIILAVLFSLFAYLVGLSGCSCGPRVPGLACWVLELGKGDFDILTLYSLVDTSILVYIAVIVWLLVRGQFRAALGVGIVFILFFALRVFDCQIECPSVRTNICRSSG